MTEYENGILEEAPLSIEDIEDVNVLAIQFDAPKKRKGRAYDADQVDGIMRQVQQDLDNKFRFIQENYAGKNVSTEVASAEQQQYVEALQNALTEAQEAITSKDTYIVQLEAMQKQLKESNAGLRKEMRKFYSGEDLSPEFFSPPVVHTPATSSASPTEEAAGILQQAETVASQHVASAKARAEDIIREAYEEATQLRAQESQHVVESDKTAQRDSLSRILAVVQSELEQMTS